MKIHFSALCFTLLHYILQRDVLNFPELEYTRVWSVLEHFALVCARVHCTELGCVGPQPVVLFPPASCAWLTLACLADRNTILCLVYTDHPGLWETQTQTQFENTSRRKYNCNWKTRLTCTCNCKMPQPTRADRRRGAITTNFAGHCSKVVLWLMVSSPQNSGPILLI